MYKHGDHVPILVWRAYIQGDMVYTCGSNRKVKAWSISKKQVKYEFEHCGWVHDIVIGREGTPLANRIVSTSYESCRISNLETGAEMKKIDLRVSVGYGSPSGLSIAVDRAQTIIAVGSGATLTFIECSNFTKVKEVSLSDPVKSLAFNKRNDCMLAVTSKGEVHSLKF